MSLRSRLRRSPSRSSCDRLCDFGCPARRALRSRMCMARPDQQRGQSSGLRLKPGILCRAQSARFRTALSGRTIWRLMGSVHKAKKRNSQATVGAKARRFGKKTTRYLSGGEFEVGTMKNLRSCPASGHVCDATLSSKSAGALGSAANRSVIAMLPDH